MLIKRKMSVNWLIFASPTLISSLYDIFIYVEEDYEVYDRAARALKCLLVTLAATFK